MTLYELMVSLRTRLSDWGGGRDYWGTTLDDRDCLWSNAELTEYLNEAQREYVRRRPIRDSSTPEVCEIAITAGVSTYPHDPRILAIHRAKLDSRDDPLERTTREEMDGLERGWEARAGLPFAYLHDESTLQLIYIPEQDDVLRLFVDRLPLADLDWDNDAVAPEIPEKDHLTLLDWASFLALDRPESDTHNAEKAAFYAQVFDTKVGRRPDARHERDRKVRFGWVKRTRAYY